MRILIVSDSPALEASGQARVVRWLGKILTEEGGHEVYYWGAVHPSSGWRAMEKYDFLKRIYPANRYDNARLKEAIEDCKPQIIIGSHDPWHYGALGEFKTKYGFKAIGYITTDGTPLTIQMESGIMPWDILVVPSWFSKEAFVKWYPHKPVSVIPYGIEPEFIPPSWDFDKKEYKDMLFVNTYFEWEKGKEGMSDKFVCCYVGHNQGRKHTALIADILRYSRIPPEELIVVVVAHTTFAPAGTIMCEHEYPIEEINYVYPYQGSIYVVHTALTEKMLQLLYKASDVFLFPTTGEAFGIPIIEASASGAIPILPFYSTAMELAGKFGFLVPENMLELSLVRGGLATRRAAPHPRDYGHILHKAYEEWKNDKTKWMERRKRAWEHAKTYTWEEMGRAFLNLVNIVYTQTIEVDTTIYPLTFYDDLRWWQ